MTAHSFGALLDRLPTDELRQRLERVDGEGVRQAMSLGPRATLEQAVALFAPAGGEQLETLARRAHHLTVQRFGRTIQLYAPLYLSNECVNVCRYCGFSATNEIPRITLSPDQVAAEAKLLFEQGFRHILLVSGEHPRRVPPQYLVDCVRRLHPRAASLAIEVGPLETDEYRAIVAAGAEGLTLYQETYHRPTYAEMHPRGYKRDFDARLAATERGAAAGFKRLGIGFLIGLSDWRREAICLLAHARFLMRHCWRAQIAISFPRLRPAAGEFDPPHPISTRELVQLITALRILLPEAGLNLSTRESPALRERLLPLGITWMSAGSRTEPGGYSHPHHDREQFAVADERPPHLVAERIRQLGYEPVWKDWDNTLTRTPEPAPPRPSHAAPCRAMHHTLSASS